MSPFSRVGYVALTGLCMLVPIAWLGGHFIPLDPFPTDIIILALGWGLLDSLTVAGMYVMLKSTGAVFGSQIAFVQTIAGVFIGVVLIGDVLSTEIWVAMAMILVGLLLVEPRRSAELQVPQARLQVFKTSDQ